MTMARLQSQNTPSRSFQYMTWGMIGLSCILIGGCILMRKHLLAAYYDFWCNEYNLHEKYEQAIASCTKAISWKPTVARYYTRAHVYTTYRDYEEAITDYTTIIALTPTDAQGYFYRGLTKARYTQFFMNTTYGQAIDDYSYALQLAPTSTWMYGFRGSAYLKNRDYEHAITDFSTALQRDLEHEWGYYEERGLAYANQGQYDQAFSDYAAFLDRMKACQACPERQRAVHVYLDRGSLYTVVGMYSEALNDYLAAIMCDTKFVDLYYVWGIASYTGEHEYALHAFNHALQREPENAVIHFGRAIVCEHAGCLKEAEESYQRFCQDTAMPFALRTFAQNRLTAMWKTRHPFYPYDSKTYADAEHEKDEEF